MSNEPRRRRGASVRIRVTALATIVVAIVLAVTGLLLVRFQRSALIDHLDDSLTADAEAFVEAIENDGLTAPTAFDDDVPVVVLRADGTVIAASGDPDTFDQLADQLTTVDIADDAFEVTLDDDRYRVVVEPVDLPVDVGGGRGLVAVGAGLDDIDESIADLTRALLWLIPPALAILAATVWVLVGRTLRPVEQIRAGVAKIGVAELDQRVPVPPGDDEVTRLAITMNDMLGRLESSVRRQQRFTADASHELRTPLTRMRAELEVDERDPTHADPVATRRSQLEEIGSMQQMIEDLLLLARSDAGRATPPSTAVDLDDIVFEEIATDAGQAADGPGVEASGVSAAQVAGSPQELRRVVRNLLDNARRHARTTVVVELAEVDGEARLVVSDDGAGIAPEDRARVFERFARLDDSRTGGAGQAGLGLAIVDDIVTRHHGTLTVDAAPHGGARFTVILPLAGPSGGVSTRTRS